MLLIRMNKALSVHKYLWDIYVHLMPFLFPKVLRQVRIEQNIQVKIEKEKRI